MILAVILVASPAAAWKAHGLEAAAALEKATDRCERALQTAYVLHLTKPELVQKQNVKAEFMHLVLTGAAKGEAFDLTYVYDRAKDALVGARVTALPKGWVIAFAEANHILVSDALGCAFDLDTTQPFKASAFEQTPSAK